MITNADAPHSDLPDDADGAIRQLYSDHAEALLSYARRFCLDQPGAADIVQERPHYALHALRAHLQDQHAAACP